MPDWAVEILKQYGLAGVAMAALAWLWLRSDTERRALQAKLNDLSVETIKIVTVMQNTIQSIKDVLTSRGRHQ